MEDNCIIISNDVVFDEDSFPLKKNFIENGDPVFKELASLSSVHVEVGDIGIREVVAAGPSTPVLTQVDGGACPQTPPLVLDDVNGNESPWFENYYHDIQCISNSSERLRSRIQDGAHSLQESDSMEPNQCDKQLNLWSQTNGRQQFSQNMTH